MTHREPWGDGLESATADVVFDLQRSAPDVFAALEAQSSNAGAAIDRLRTAIPVMPSALPGRQGPVYRLHGHNRSVCLTLADDPATSDVIVLKGSEPLLPDFRAYVEWMTRRQFGAWPRPMSEHFPLFEGKAPGTVFLDEAMREAEIALDVQRRHLAEYGALMRLPVPVFVFKLPLDAETAVVGLLRSALSEPAFDRVAPHLGRGIGIFAYYYPGPPVRVHAVGRAASFGPAPRTLAARPHIINETLPGWFAIAARLLWLGFLPTSPLAWRLGDIFDANNACLDGGVCDVNSIYPMTKAPSDGFFIRSVVMITGGLRIATARAFGLPLGEIAQSYEQELAAFCLGEYVKRGLAQALDAEARPNLRLDSRVGQVFEARTLPELLQLFETFNSYLGAADYVPAEKTPGSVVRQP